MHMCNGNNPRFIFIISFCTALIKIFYRTHNHTDLNKVMISGQILAQFSLHQPSTGNKDYSGPPSPTRPPVCFVSSSFSIFIQQTPPLS